jgi:hypothetical protein
MTRQRSGRFRRLLILIALVGLVFVFLAAFRAGPAPQISVEAELPGIGKSTPIRVVVTEPKRGLAAVRVEFVQGERVHQLAARSYTPIEPWTFWGERTDQDEFALVVGSETLEHIEEGPAIIRVVADRASAWLRYPGPAIEELEIPVRLRPPGLQVLSTHTYVKQGGCEAVVYTVGESAIEDGVQAGEWWFPGFPMSADEPRKRFALFAAPYDLDDAEQIRIVARDAVGNEARSRFIDRFTRRPPKTDTIRISDEFMERVVSEMMSRTGLRDRGGLLENYLAINGELRAHNNKVLRELAGRSVQRVLWGRDFLQMRNAVRLRRPSDLRVQRSRGRPARPPGVRSRIDTRGRDSGGQQRSRRGGALPRNLR